MKTNDLKSTQIKKQKRQCIETKYNSKHSSAGLTHRTGTHAGYCYEYFKGNEVCWGCCEKFG